MLKITFGTTSTKGKMYAVVIQRIMMVTRATTNTFFISLKGRSKKAGFCTAQNEIHSITTLVMTLIKQKYGLTIIPIIVKLVARTPRILRISIETAMMINMWIMVAIMRRLGLMPGTIGGTEGMPISIVCWGGACPIYVGCDR